MLESLIFNDADDTHDNVAATVVPDEDAIKEQLHKDKLTREDVQNAVFDAVRRINRRLPSYKAIRHVFIREKSLDKTSLQKPRRGKGAVPQAAQETGSEEKEED